MDYINKRIQKEICTDTLDKLQDMNLLEKYMDCTSVKNKINKFKFLLLKYVDNEICDKIIQEYIIDIIPPGTKGVIKGNMFNVIVKNYINCLNLDKDLFEICFEKKHTEYITDEKPDWYIFQKSTKKILIGMNQLDLWNGGHQSNRGSKYICTENYKDEYLKDRKILCVICNKIQFTNKNKTYYMFKKGFEDDTLCYLNNLKNIIYTYFNIETC